MNRRKLIATILFTFCMIMNSFGDITQKKYDIVIYGATSAGISAAIQCSRMNKTILLIEPTNRIGGLTTGGLGATDIGSKIAIGGISREFYRNVKRYYDDPKNWTRQNKADYSQSRNDKNDDAMWTFEPSVALKIYKEMMKNESIDLVHNKRLLRDGGIKKEGASITEIKMESGEVYKGKMFIDATYEGDLMAAAGVSYTVGRESNKLYGETLNGVQLDKVNRTLTNKISLNALHHNFINRVDPYIIKGKPESGLLPYVSTDPPGVDGEGDKKIQAYCFRMTLTDDPDNRIPFKKPENYNELNYELLFRNYEAADGPIEEMYYYNDNPYVPWINTLMPNRKTDTNNQKGFSTDFIGQNYAYPEASYEEREQIVEEHLNFQKGLMWTLAYHPRTPEKVREVASQWGVCKDEFTDNEDHWSRQLYIREARRMVSDYVMTQKNCEGIEIAEDPIAMAGYGMDSHHVQRYVDVNGFVQNEGNVEARGFPPYPVSYRSIVPRKDECSNLLVPVCISASHIAFGSLRMEPVFMILGQTAAIAAAQAIDDNVKIQDINYTKLAQSLIKFKQILKVQLDNLHVSDL